MKKNQFTLPIIIALITTCSGCGLSVPWNRRPGHEAYQQLRATRYDPYPDMNAAPAFADGRPQQYQVQRSEPTRSQWSMDAQR